MAMQLPAHLANRQRRDLATSAMGGINSGQPPHLSIKDNRFTLVDAAGNLKPMQTLFIDVCIIDANASVSKIYYNPNTPYDPSGDNNNPPLCFSDNGVGASAQAPQPQSQSCAMCPHNAWGSAVSKMTGKQVKACNDLKKLAFVVPGDPNNLVYQMRVPPASLKNLAQYTQTVAGHGVDLPDVITRLEFESQGVLRFNPVGFIDEATMALTDKILAANATDILVGRNDRPWNGVGLPAPQQAQQLAPPVQQAPAQQFMPPPQPMQQVPQTPFAPAAQQPVSGFPAATPAAQTFPTTSPSEPPKQRKQRKPRTPKAQAAPVDPQNPPFMQAPAADLPPFLQDQPATSLPAAPAQTQQNFGMEPSPPAPDAGMQAALDAAFRLPT